MQQRQKSTRMYQVPHTKPLDSAIGRGTKASTYDIRPMHLFCGALACVAATLAVTGIAGYFIFQNELLSDTSAEREELVLEYQDHIDRLRFEIETLTSRQMVDRESVEIQVLDVLRRQKDLDKRHALVADLVARAESIGIYLGDDKPVPPQKPSLASIGLSDPNKNDASAIGGESNLIDEPVKALGLRDSTARRVDPLRILQQNSDERSQNAMTEKKTLKNEPL